jgi:cytidylate kinase
MSVVVHFNGPHGVGKLSVARLVAVALGARLLDSHTVSAVERALAPEGEAAAALAASVRRAAYAAAAALPAAVPVVLTDVVPDTPAGDAAWREVAALAADRGAALVAVTLTVSDPAAWRARVEHPLRREGKVRDWRAADRLAAGGLLWGEADARVEVDTAGMSAGEVAARVLSALPALRAAA